MLMNKELTLKRLEVLLKIALNGKPCKILKYEEDRLAKDLLDMGLIERNSKESINAVPCCYSLNDNGEKYVMDILKYSSEYFEKHLNSN